MERNDSSIKEILDQISRDDAKAVVEEVRGILLRDLSTDSASSSKDQPNQEVVRRDTAQSATPRQSDAIKTNSRQHNHAQQKNTDAPENELAFTIEKDSETYKNIYSMVEWHRDSYLVGTEFADRRTSQKKSINPTSLGYDTVKFAEIRDKLFNNNIHYRSLFGRDFIQPKPSEFTGMGYPFLTDYAEWYIQSTYARDLLRPTAMWIASKDGPMMTPAIQSMASTIPMMQDMADGAMKSNVLWMLQDLEWKDWAKSLTTQYVYRSQKDD